MDPVQEDAQYQKELLRENEKAERRNICKAIYDRLYDSTLDCDDLKRVGNSIAESVTDVENRA